MEKTVLINLTIPEESLPEIKDFIVSYGYIMAFSLQPGKGALKYYALEIKESDYSFLKLKFGSDNVWLR